MIVLFTDFGSDDIYVGQVHAVLAEQAPGVRVIDLLHTAPDFDVRSSAYLLNALRGSFPVASVFMAVIDPGVGGDRAPLMVEADGLWFVAPDNGLLTRVIRSASSWSANKVLWTPMNISPSFHGRDLFAPMAAMIASGSTPEHAPIDPVLCSWPDNLDRIIYIDHYGNAITGRSGSTMSKHYRISIGDREIPFARVFCESDAGELFWYVNSIGLVEVAASRARAVELLGIRVGDVLRVVSG